MSIEVFIYIPGRLPVPRQEIEDALEELLEDLGEVTGAGLGERGANLDVEIFENEHGDRLIEEMRQKLLGLGLPEETVIDRAGERTDLLGRPRPHQA